MFGVAMIAIWIGLLGIAFSDNVGEEKFMILFFGFCFFSCSSVHG